MKNFIAIFLVFFYIRGGIVITKPDNVKTKLDKNFYVYIDGEKVCHWNDLLFIESDKVNSEIYKEYKDIKITYK